MMVTLTFWQEYGPRIILTGAIALVGLILLFIGRGAARACEAKMRSTAADFRALHRKARARRRDGYARTLDDLADKAATARRTHTAGVYLLVGGLTFTLTGEILRTTSLDWVVTLPLDVLGAVIAIAVAHHVLHVTASARQAQLEKETCLEEGGVQ